MEVAMLRALNYIVVSILILVAVLMSACARMPIPTIVPTLSPPTATPIPPTVTPTPVTPIPPTLTPTPVPPTPTLAPFTFTSTAFVEGGNIPAKYTCNAENVSPPLSWNGGPNAKSYVLTMEDPDAVVMTFTHWVLFDLPSTQKQLPENMKGVGKGGANSAKRNVYLGPCPPSGIHRFYFTLYALDVESLGLNEGATLQDIDKAMTGHTLAKIQLMGKYGK
jgi:Raf kinase inhibitor-like YbhB/YbcL family protein